MTVRIDRVDGVATIVGESPVWDASTGALWFIDIVGETLHRLAADGRLDTWPTDSSPGAVAVVGDGRVLVALEEGFAVFDPERGVFGPEESVDPGEGARISEGKVDRSGRFVVTSGDRGFRAPIGRIVRREGPGRSRVLREELGLGNGLSWSVDGRTVYFADSLRSTIFAADYDPEAGITRERAFFSTDLPGAFPDGATVDAEDHLWTVIHGSSQVLRINPAGAVVATLDLPTPMLTSIAFAGPELDVAYVTSLDPSRIPGLPPERAHDGAAFERGLLYRVEGLGVRGIAEPYVALGA